MNTHTELRPSKLPSVGSASLANAPGGLAIVAWHTRNKTLVPCD